MGSFHITEYLFFWYSETIWQSAVEVCEEVQELQKPKGSILLHEYMWRQLFAATTSSALEYMLHHIADRYQTKED